MGERKIERERERERKGERDIMATMIPVKKID